MCIIRVWVNPGSDAAISAQDYECVVETVEETVFELGGSFSAEHGIGKSKLSSMARRKDAGALSAMRTIKFALDPNNIMNPGKVLPPDNPYRPRLTRRAPALQAPTYANCSRRAVRSDGPNVTHQYHLRRAS